MNVDKVNLSERIRANSEAAPWVIDEVKAMEEEIEQLRDELAAAKAASVVPVDIVCVYQSGWGQYASAELKSEEDAVALMKWLRDRVKERSEG